MAGPLESDAVLARPTPIPALTGLRSIGAAWVALYHFQPTLYAAWPALKFFAPILANGDYGVSLFFALSGFIIWHNYGDRSLLHPRPTVRFLWRRFARLWPVNLLTTLLSVPLIWWAVTQQGYWGSPVPSWYSKFGLLKSIFMVEELGQPNAVAAWNQPSWTLTGEMVAYVVFPALLALIVYTGLLRARNRWIWAILGLGIAYLIQDREWMFPSRWLLELVLLFIAGVFLRIAGIASRRLGVFPAIIQVAAPIGIVFVCYAGRAEFIPVLLAAWVWSLSATGGPGVWLFSQRGWQVAGLSSYSLYMFHWVIFGYGYLVLYYFPVVQRSFLGLFVVCALAAVALTSWVSWKCYETPARRLLNRTFERVWRSKSAPAPSDEPSGEAQIDEAAEFIDHPTTSCASEPDSLTL